MSDRGKKLLKIIISVWVFVFFIIGTAIVTTIISPAISHEVDKNSTTSNNEQDVVLVQTSLLNKLSYKLEDVNFGYHSLDENEMPEQNFLSNDIVQIVFKDGCRGNMKIYSGWEWITYKHPVRFTSQGIRYLSKKEIEIGEEIYKKCDDVLALPKEEIIQKVKDILNVEKKEIDYEGSYIYFHETLESFNEEKVEAVLDYLNGNCLKAKELLENGQ